jgi:hypothetical protein
MVPMNNGEMAPGLEQCVRFRKPRLGRDPMQRRRNTHEVEGGHEQLCRLEGSIDNLNVRVRLQPVAGDARHVGAKLDTGDASPSWQAEGLLVRFPARSRGALPPRNPARRTSSLMSTPGYRSLIAS